MFWVVMLQVTDTLPGILLSHRAGPVLAGTVVYSIFPYTIYHKINVLEIRIVA